MENVTSTRFSSIAALESNSHKVFVESTEVLIRIAKNVLNDPSNPKFRSISLESHVVTNKLLTVPGAMECLHEMGFQRSEKHLFLPQSMPLDSIEYIHNELVKKREMHLKSSIITHKTVMNPVKNQKLFLLAQDLITLSSQTNDSFLKKIILWCFYVIKYENYELQLKALKLVPMADLNLKVVQKIRRIQMEFKKKKIANEKIDFQYLLLIELCNWFNTEFFEWVDSPKCSKCNFIESTYVGMSDEKFSGASRVEVYKCKKCNERILFPRYNNPNILLETRKGRCGEWANCFCLFLRAMGWDARLVFDETDHVWVEVYLILESRWVHCDPCENAVDTPLVYETGWKKKLSYVIAYSKDEIQDVTWRYSVKHAQILKNRKKCSEQDLVNFIIKVRNILLARESPTRRNFVLKRTALELVDLMKEHSASTAEEKGRISGSLEWRLMRGETSNEDNFKPYVWKLEDESHDKKKFILTYNTSKDEYTVNSKRVVKNWSNGLYTLKSVFRKEEKDWKMTYLARTEGSDRGILSWKFESGDKFSIETINLKLVRRTFETGMVVCNLSSDETCVFLPDDKESFFTDAFAGKKTVELIVELFGGQGSGSWAHAQIFRQPLNSEENTFEIVINLKRI